MQVFQQFKWLAVSLVLHLLVINIVKIVQKPKQEMMLESITLVTDSFVPVEQFSDTAWKKSVPVIGLSTVTTETVEISRDFAKQREPLLSSMQQNRESELSSAEQKQTFDIPEPVFKPAVKPVLQKLVENPVPELNAKRINVENNGLKEYEVPDITEKNSKRYLKDNFGYIRDLVMKQLIYPTVAKKMHWSGKVTLFFTVLEDGNVQNLKVIESSGFVILDKSATDTVLNAAPFPKPLVRSDITLPVSFKLM